MLGWTAFPLWNGEKIGACVYSVLVGSKQNSSLFSDCSVLALISSDTNKYKQASLKICLPLSFHIYQQSLCICGTLCQKVACEAALPNPNHNRRAALQRTFRAKTETGCLCIQFKVGPKKYFIKGLAAHLLVNLPVCILFN